MHTQFYLSNSCFVNIHVTCQTKIILFNMEIAKRSRFCDGDVKILLCAYGKCQVEDIKKYFAEKTKLNFVLCFLFLCQNDFMWERSV